MALKFSFHFWFRADFLIVDSTVVCHLVQNEEDRKAKHGGYVELGATEQIAREKAREGKEQYRQALMANKAKLKEAQARRPSLIQRHDQVRTVSTMATRSVVGEEECCIFDSLENQQNLLWRIRAFVFICCRNSAGSCESFP